ncbi:hypothetical protein GCM10022281_17780 [Sphingomonas rosea]|uniref:N-acetyltransferase domain-containing protein n=1 Tax=Sphingomonas rosea TaxID=335605 RepID=A0ABP7U7V6_9SPHN
MSGLAPDSLTIQRGGGADLDEVMAVMADAFDPRFGEAWTRAQCAGILPLPGVILHVARRRGEALGFSLSRRAMDEAELLLIAVRRQASGQGIGGQLIARFVEDHRAAGAHHLHLEVRDGNPAVSLYTAHDFEIAGRRSRYYRGTDGELFDALTMVRMI